MQNEAKVGLFFLVALIVTAAVVVFLGDYAAAWSSITVHVHFADVAGLEPGAEVRLSGVRIGRVQQVLLKEYAGYPGRRAWVSVALKRDAKIYRNDNFFVEQGALIGDKYVSIVSRPRPKGEQRIRVEDKDHVPGSGLSGLSGLANEAEDLMADAKRTLSRIELALTDPERMMKVDQIVDSVVALTARADEVSVAALKFAHDLVAMSSAAGPQVDEISRNIGEASETVRSTVHMVKNLIETSPVHANVTKASENMVTLSENFTVSSEDVKRLTAKVSAMLDDPILTAKLQDALDNLHTASENLAALAEKGDKLISDEEGVGEDLKVTMANLRRATDDLATTSAHVREVITDPQLTEDLKVSVHKAREALEEAPDMAAKASRSLDRVDGTMDRVSETMSAIRPERTETHVSLEVADDAGFRADFNADLYYRLRRDDYWRIGIRDIGDHERLNLQRSLPVSSVSSVRGGVFGGQPGIGYEHSFGDKLTLEMELWDPDVHLLDLRGRYMIRPGLELTVGANDMFHEKDPSIGLRYYLRQGFLPGDN